MSYLTKRKPMSAEQRFAIFVESRNLDYRIIEYLTLPQSKNGHIDISDFLDYCHSNNTSFEAMFDRWGSDGTLFSIKTRIIELSKDKISFSNKSKYPSISKFNRENSTNKRKSISGRVRQNVFMRDKYTCQICGATVKDGVKLEIDHIIPVSKGGSNKENNLQTLCKRCNREKRNRTDLLHDKLKLEELNGKY